MSIYSVMPNSNFLFSKTLKSNTKSRNLLYIDSFVSEITTQIPTTQRVIEDGYDCLKIPIGPSFLLLDLFQNYFIEKTQYTFSLTVKCSIASRRPRFEFVYSDGTKSGLIGSASLTTWTTETISSRITSTIEKTISKITGSYASAANTPDYFIRLDNAQLEKDNIATEYTSNDSFFKI